MEEPITHALWWISASPKGSLVDILRPLPIVLTPILRLDHFKAITYLPCIPESPLVRVCQCLKNLAFFLVRFVIAFELQLFILSPDLPQRGRRIGLFPLGRSF